MIGIWNVPDRAIHSKELFVPQFCGNASRQRHAANAENPQPMQVSPTPRNPLSPICDDSSRAVMC
jgi:hypothetical protein